MLGFDALGKHPVGAAPSASAATTNFAKASPTEANDTVSSSVTMVRPKGRGRPITANTWLVRRQRRKTTSLFYRDASIQAAGSPNPTAWAEWFFPRENLPATAAITEADDTLVAVGALGSGSITADSAITEAADTLVATAVTSRLAEASITEANDTLTSAATLALRAQAAITEADDTLTAAAGLEIRASASITEGNDTLTAVVEPVNAVNASLTVTEGNDTVVCVGVVFGYPPGFNVTNLKGSPRLSASIRGAPRNSLRLGGSNRMNVRTGSR